MVISFFISNVISVHPETTLKIPKLQLWTPNNGHIGVQIFRFGIRDFATPKAEDLDSKKS
jgi:hypothetical protein